MSLPVRQVADPGAQQNWEYLAARLIFGNGNPEGRIKAPIGAMFINGDGGAGTTVYIKESGAGTDTGWVGK